MVVERGSLLAYLARFFRAGGRVGLLLFLVIGAAHAWPATVVDIADGDTFAVINQTTGERVRVRLAGVAAPEVDHGPGRPGQPFGPEATKAMAVLLSAGAVRVHPNGTTSYDRIVARVTAGHRDVAAALIALGLAWNHPRYTPDYADVQEQAQAKNRGLWQQADPIPPWRWRHKRWQ